MNFLNDLKQEVVSTAKFNFQVLKRIRAGEKDTDVYADLVSKGQLPLSVSAILDATEEGMTVDGKHQNLLDLHAAKQSMR